MPECDCLSCQSACTNKPGWFMPGEAEKLADFLSLSFEDVFKNHLSIDWWEADSDFKSDTFVLSPAVVDGDPGEEFDADPHGTCVFYIDGKCSIHEVKPFECRELIHTDGYNEAHPRHMSVARAWENADSQGQIKELLGREPYAAEYVGSIFNMF